MINVFKNDENAYILWLKSNKSGFVFNNFGGRDPSYNIIHKTDCRTLKRKTDEGSKTTIEKICSENLKELVVEVTKIRGSAKDWCFCKICLPTNQYNNI